MHPELGPIGILSALSLLLPLPWHWRAGNVATLSIIAWLFSINIIYAINAIIWSDNVDIVAQVWCDIATKLMVGANFALPAACLCICIHLEQVASARLTQSSFSVKRRRQWFEGLMCFGLPAVFMALHYIVQGHRYDIIEGYGCRPSIYVSIPAILIIWIPPILLSTAAIIFAGLALRHFVLRRLSFAAHLGSSNAALTPSRYLRLMTMAALQMVWSITITSYTLAFTLATLKVRPWTTWDKVHSDWLRVDQFPEIFTPPFVKSTFYGMWWFIPISTFLFVVFFSFGKDATDEYKKCYAWLRAKVLPLTSYVNLKKRDSSSSSLPVFQKGSIQDLTISNPVSLTTTYSVNTPSYDFSASSPTTKKMSVTSGSNHGSEFTCPIPTYLYREPKAIGSYGDLSMRTPSTAVGSSPMTFKSKCDVDKALPSPPLLTAFPSNPRPRLGPSPKLCSPPSRPLTYPSFEATELNVSLPSETS